MARRPGQRCDYMEIAIWCDCSRERIRQIEQKALKKLRAAWKRRERVLLGGRPPSGIAT